MLKRTILSKSLLIAFSGTAALAGSAVYAQQADQAPVTLQRVEITGSSIKRINAETALPVTVITAEDIKKSGFTSTTDLIQSLPSMQGFVTASQSVNGGGGGVATASLHSIGSSYTLVLLNGRRMAPYNTGTTINLNSIPLSAIERIEVLTDGASALYGADAIAGVVNFITKKNSTEGDVSLSVSAPQHPGGKSGNFSLSKGFGNLDKDGFNVFLALSYDKQNELNASQRDFSKTGYIPFTDQGRSLTTFLASSNSIPGTVLVNSPGANYPTDPNDVNSATSAGGAFYSPNLLKTGSCPPLTRLRGGVCRFDYSSTVQAIPESERSTLYGSGHLKLSDAATLFSEVVFSSFNNKPRYAPPAQPGIYLTQALVDKHVTPYLSQLGLTPADVIGVSDPNGNGPSMNLRLYDAGGRQDEYKTDSLHLVLGAEGNVSNWDYSTSFTHSQNTQTDRALSGYTSANAFNGLVSSGAFDPLEAQIGQSTAVLAPAVLHQILDTSKSSIDILSGRVSRPVMQLAGGDAAVGLGVDVGRQSYKDDPSAISQGKNSLQPTFTDSIIGGSGGALPFDSRRNTLGAFTELVLPVTKALELTGAVRYDKFDAVSNSKNFDASGNLVGSANQGKSASAVTYKLSARFQPTQELLFRGSYGTGFKAPTLRDITFPVQAFGSTGFHDCPPGLAANLAAYCRAGSSEYNLRQGGNPNSDSTGLDPEKSTQWTLGFRIEPSPALSFGVDLWSVNLKQRIDVIPEDVAFSDGVTYGSAFSVKADPITGLPTLTFTQAPANLGKARYKGLDFDVGSHVNTPLGRLSGRATMTYMIQSDYEIPGLPGYQSSLGNVGPDTQVTFRWLANLSASLETGAFTNTFNLSFKPSYADQVATKNSGPEIRVVKPDGSIGARAAVTRTVGSYTLIDWQGKYKLNSAFTLTGGIKNIFDTKPPFSIQDEPGTGNMRGYDARYTDALGRQFYVTGSYKF